MAIKIKLTDAKVIKHLNRTGFQVEVPMEGVDWTRKFTIWHHSNPGLDSIVDIVGDLSWKNRQYEANGETRTTIDMNVNNPEVTVKHSAPVEQYYADHSTPIPLDEAPF